MLRIRASTQSRRASSSRNHTRSCPSPKKKEEASIELYKQILFVQLIQLMNGVIDRTVPAKSVPHIYTLFHLCVPYFGELLHPEPDSYYAEFVDVYKTLPLPKEQKGGGKALMILCVLILLSMMICVEAQVRRVTGISMTGVVRATRADELGIFKQTEISGTFLRDIYMSTNFDGICVWNSHTFMASAATIGVMARSYGESLSSVVRKYSVMKIEDPKAEIQMFKGATAPVLYNTTSTVRKVVVKEINAALRDKIPEFSRQMKQRFPDTTDSHFMVLSIYWDVLGGPGHAFNIVVNIGNPHKGYVIDANYLKYEKKHGGIYTTPGVADESIRENVTVVKSLADGILESIGIHDRDWRNGLQLSMDDPSTMLYSTLSVSEVTESFEASRKGMDELRKTYGTRDAPGNQLTMLDRVKIYVLDTFVNLSDQLRESLPVWRRAR